MTETATLTRFDVIFDVEARNTAEFRNEITVHLRGQHPVTVELPTDEGAKHGGDGTAPYPLAYFASALTACIMTQLRAFSRRLDIPLTTIAIVLIAEGAAEEGFFTSNGGAQCDD